MVTANRVYNERHYTANQLTIKLICDQCVMKDKKRSCNVVHFEFTQHTIHGAAIIKTECLIEKERSDLNS